MDEQTNAPRPGRVPAAGDPPESRLLRYADLPARTFRRLPLARTLAVLAVGPLEVHGPHLPLGTDPILAAAIARRAVLRFLAAHPERFALELPPCMAGADTVGHPGSVEIPARAVQELVTATGMSLARSGLWGLMVVNFHGGPRHNVALEQAMRTVRRRHPGFLAFSPMGDVLSRLFGGDPALRAAWRTRSGWTEAELDRLSGDLHAGRLETSAMLAERPGDVDAGFRSLERHETGVSRLLLRAVKSLEAFGPLFGRARTKSFLRDVSAMIEMLAWAERPRLSYMGAPALADAATGRRLLDQLGEEVATILEDLAAGRRRPEDLDPFTWAARWLLLVPSSFPWTPDAPS
jgi:creatinine amidohydrolase